jgi:hypothetical protein
MVKIMMSRNLTYAISILVTVAAPAVAIIADFEDLVLQPDSCWNGSDGSGGFNSGSAYFENYYDSEYGMWGGFAYSNITDTLAEGWDAQYNAIPGTGQAGSENYAIGYQDSFNGITPTFHLNQPGVIDSIWVTNCNYAYYSMLNGDLFAKKFGGVSDDDPDWFRLDIIGLDEQGNVTKILPFYLADFRFADNSEDYIVNDWTEVDLTALGEVKTIQFQLSSSDMGDWGMNTPAYFAVDTIVPEPATIIFLGFGGLLLGRKPKRVNSF